MAKPTYIYLERDAELAELIEVLRSHKSDSFVVVAPEGSKIFSHPINIEILQKEIDNLDKKIVFDTPDTAAQKMLKKYGFKLVSEEVSEEKAQVVVSDIKPKTPQVQEMVASSIIDQIWGKEPKIKEAKKERKESAAKPKVRISRFFFITLGGILVFAVFAYWFLSFYLARAQILVTSQKINHAFDYSVNINSSIQTSSPADLALPGKIINISLNLSKSYPTTGSDTLNSRARGLLDVYNNFSTGSQILVATTRFQSADGKIFRTLKRVVIVGATMQGNKLTPGITTIEVVADQPGPDYNVAPGKFTIPGFQGTVRSDKFWAVSKQPMTGGALGQTKTVSPDDLTNARNDITKTLTDALNTQFALGYKDYSVLENNEAVSVRVTSYLPDVGEAGDKLTVNAVGNLNAFGYKQADLGNLVQALESNYLSPTQQLVKISLDTSTPSNIDMNKGMMTLEIKGSSVFQEKVDVSALKNAILGKSTFDLQGILKGFQGVSKADISLWPFWIKRIPADFNKIQISVQ